MRVYAHPHFGRYLVPRTAFEPLFRVIEERLSPYLLPEGSITEGLLPAPPRMDVIEYEDRYVIQMDAPGVRIEEVVVQIQDQRVSITIERKPTEQNGRVLVKERIEGCQRTLMLSSELADDGHEATLRDGVLTVTVRKKAPEPQRPKVRTIQVT